MTRLTVQAHKDGKPVGEYVARSSSKNEQEMADWMHANRKDGIEITWTDSQLHHVISRARGGSDVLENLQLIRHACHAAIHGGLKWGERGRA